MLNDSGIPLVLFSGGVDSTGVLLSALRKYETDDVLTVELTAQDNKNEREREAADTILQAIRNGEAGSEELGDVRWVSRTQAPGYRLDDAIRFTQGVSWMACAIPFITRRTNDIQLGYVVGDQGLSLLRSMQYAWGYMLDAAGQVCEGDVRPALSAPLFLMSKLEVIQALPPKILALTSWCEDLGSSGTDCGCCPSCKRMLRELSAWKAMDPEDYEKKFIAKSRYELMLERYKEKRSNSMGDEHEEDNNHEIET